MSEVTGWTVATLTVALALLLMVAVSIQNGPIGPKQDAYTEYTVKCESYSVTAPCIVPIKP